MKIQLKRNQNASTAQLPPLSAGEPLWFKDKLYIGSVGGTAVGAGTQESGGVLTSGSPIKVWDPNSRPWLEDGFTYPRAVQDADGNWYRAVVIGNQVWLAENWKCTRLPDGTPLVRQTGEEEADFSDTEARYFDWSMTFAWYRYRYGLLYNGVALMNGADPSDASPSGVQGLAPSGWHIPSAAEFTTLTEWIKSQPRYRYTDYGVARALSTDKTSRITTADDSNKTGLLLDQNNKSGFDLAYGGRFYYNYNQISRPPYRAYLWTASESSVSAGDLAIFSQGYTNDEPSLTAYAGNRKNFYSVRLLSDRTPQQFWDWYTRNHGSHYWQQNEPRKLWVDHDVSSLLGSDVTPTEDYLSSSNNWLHTYSAVKKFLIPLNNIIRVKIKARPSNAAIIAFCKGPITNINTSGTRQQATVVSGHGWTSVSAGTEQSFEVPAEAEYLYVAYNSGSYGTTINIPDYIYFTGCGITEHTGDGSGFIKDDGSVDHNTYALASAFGSYLPLAGGSETSNLMTGPIFRKFTNAADSPVICMASGNYDNWLWRIKASDVNGETPYPVTSQAYGFGAKYRGSGSGNNNSYQFWADNQTGEAVKAIEIFQDGTISIEKAVTSNGAITAAGFIKSGRTADKNILLADGSDIAFPVSDFNETDAASNAYIKAKPLFGAGTYVQEAVPYTSDKPLKQVEYSMPNHSSGTGPSFNAGCIYQSGFEARVTALSPNTGTWRILGSIATSGQTYSEIGGIIGNSSGTISFCIQNTSIVTSSITRTANHIYTVDLKLDSGTATLYVKDETDGTEATDTGTYTSMSSGYNAIVWRDGPNRAAKGIKTYRVETWLNGVKQSDWIPVKNASNGNYGFYNTITGTVESGTTFGGGSVVDKSLVVRVPTVNDATLTIAVGGGLTLSDSPTFTANASVNKTITITHPSGLQKTDSKIYKITTDAYGHVNGAVEATASDITAIMAGGTSGQYLKSNGSSTAPSWENLPTASTSTAGITIVGASGGAAAYDHNHGNITNDGKVGSAANLPLITGTGGAVTTGSFGNAANTFCEGNDARLSDARTPNNDSNIVHKDNAETITGLKTFTNGLILNTGTSWTNTDRAIPFSKSEDPETIQYVYDNATKGLTFNPNTGVLKAAKFVKRSPDSSPAVGILLTDGSDIPQSTFLTSFTETDPTVHAWAKAENKPSYSYTEITGTPTNVSAFTNDAGYLTSFTETDPTVHAWAKAENKPSYSYSEIGNAPTDLGDFTNSAGYVKTDRFGTVYVDTAAATKAKTANVSFDYTLRTGNTFILYLKNTNSNTAATLNINSTGAKSVRINGAAPTSSNWAAGTYLCYYDGTYYQMYTAKNPYNYNDLDNQPTIPTVPTNVSAFNNDAGYLTSFTETDPTVHAWAKASTKPSYTLDEVSDGTNRKLLVLGDSSITAAAGNHTHDGVYQPVGNYLTAESNGFGKVSVAAQSTGTSNLSGTTASATLNSDSAADTLNIATGNKWIQIKAEGTAAASTADTDKLTFGHIVPGVATTGGSLQKFNYDDAGHITAVSTPTASDLTGIIGNAYSTTDTNYYPSGVSWTGGGANGPTGTITIAGGGSDVSIPAIPAASSNASGIITTGEQTIAGVKKFTSDVWLYAASGDTPALVFQRGSATTYYDWRIMTDSSGLFKIDVSKNASSFTNIVSANADAGITVSNVTRLTAPKFVKSGGTVDQILLANGDNVAAGTANYYLKANGAGNAPTWEQFPTIPEVPSGAVFTDEKVTPEPDATSTAYPMLLANNSSTPTTNGKPKYSANLSATGTGDIVFTKSSTTGTIQYDGTDKCFKFIFS